MPDNIKIKGKLASTFKPRDTERYRDISGVTETGRIKAHVILRYYNQYSDGTTEDIDMLTIEKPVVKIFSHAGYKNVYLDFGSGNDMDLRMVWRLLSNYNDVKNAVSYLPEELERGTYDAGDGERMVFFPVIQLALSPIGRENEYQIQGYNPAFFTLAPGELNGESCVLQFTFPDEWLVVVNDIEPVDYKKIHSEVMSELNLEHR